MLHFDDDTQVLLHDINSDFQRQFALNVFGGMTPINAYKSSCKLFNRTPANNAHGAAYQLSQKTSIQAFLSSARNNSDSYIVNDALLQYADRRQLLDELAVEGLKQFKAGNSSAGTVASNALKQIQVMTTDGAADEFSHLSNAELKRLAGESD